MSKQAFSVADLQGAAKRLHDVIPEEKAPAESKESLEENREATQKLG